MYVYIPPNVCVHIIQYMHLCMSLAGCLYIWMYVPRWLEARNVAVVEHHRGSEGHPGQLSRAEVGDAPAGLQTTMY